MSESRAPVRLVIDQPVEIVTKNGAVLIDPSEGVSVRACRVSKKVPKVVGWVEAVAMFRVLGIGRS